MKENAANQRERSSEGAVISPMRSERISSVCIALTVSPAKYSHNRTAFSSSVDTENTKHSSQSSSDSVDTRSEKSWLHSLRGVLITL